MARRAADRSTEERAEDDPVFANGGQVPAGQVSAGQVSAVADTGPVPVVEALPPEPDPRTAAAAPAPGGPDGPGPDPVAGPAAAPADAPPEFATAPSVPTNPAWIPPAAAAAAAARNGPSDRPVRPRPPRGPRVVQGRRSRRVVRRIDSWTVFKLSFLFYLCGGLILLIAGIALWNIAGAFDVITNIEKFIQKLFDLQTFKLQADVILAWSAIGTAVLVLLGTGANVLMALLYNLISDVIGGVQVIVLEETDMIGQTSSERSKGRMRGRFDDRITRERDRSPTDDPAVSA